MRREVSDLAQEANAAGYIDGWIGQPDLLLQVLAGTGNVAPAGLPVTGVDGVVGGIGVGHQGAVKVLSQQQQGAVAGTIVCDLEEGQVLMAAIPDEVTVAILPPTRLIGVGYR